MNEAPREISQNEVDSETPPAGETVAEDRGDPAPETTETEAADAGPEENTAEPEPRNDDLDQEDDEDGVEDDDDDDDEPEENGPEDPDAPQLPLAAIVEAVLFAARAPLKPSQIARAVGRGTRQELVRRAVEELNVHYLETSRAFEIAELSGCYQLMSRPEYVRHILRIYPKKDLAEREKSNRLTPAAMDTLAIIAYRQPVTRGEIEHIRGVGCGPVLRALIERGSVKIAGKRSDLVGQPLMYGTTEHFLVEFGMASLDELPERHRFQNAPLDTPDAGPE